MGQGRGWGTGFLGSLGLFLLLMWPEPAGAASLEILAAGDVLPGGRMLEAPQAGTLFGPLTRRRLEQADIFLWNCEIAGLSSVSKQNTFIFHTDGRFFPQLAFANGAACTANNHVFDGLEEGAAHLMGLLDGAGIRHNGLYHQGGYMPLSLLPDRMPPVYLLTGSPMSQTGSGPHVLTLSYPQLLERVRALRAQEPEAWIILYSHDGTEGSSEASGRQRLWAERFAAAGADVIFFAHSHCYGGFEVLENSPRRTFVAWGLGNFLFGGNRAWRNRNDVRLLSLRLDTDSGAKSACWLYGRTRDWRFSLYHMDEALLLRLRALGARAAALLRPATGHPVRRAFPHEEVTGRTSRRPAEQADVRREEGKD